MSSNANSLPNLISFPEDRQLVGISNWAIFRDHLRSVARATGLTGYLDGTISPPASVVITSTSSGGTTSVPVPPAPTPINSRTPSIEEWELRDGRLAGIIYQNIRDPRSIGITELLSAHETWNRLTSEFDNSSAAAQALAKERIQQFRYTPGTPFEEYFRQLEALRKAASDVGCVVTDDDLRSRFLTSLSSDHLWVIQNHGSRKYADLKRVLIEYDMMVESALPSSSSSPVPNALATPRSSSGGVVCDNCKRVGHMKKNCWAKGGGSEGKGPRWYNAPKGMELTPKPVSAATSIMEEDNHFTAAATIYDFSDYDFGGTVELLCYPSYPDAQPHRLGEQEIFALLSGEQDSGNMSSVLPASVHLDNPSNPNVHIPTFIDSGASHWCIRSRRRFISYMPTKRTGRMAAEGSSGSFRIEGHGIAEIAVRTTDGSIHKLRFQASHTPSFAMNLLSLPSMDRKGLKGEWGNGKINVREPSTGKVIVNGCLAGHRGGHGLYQVDVVDDLDYPQPVYVPSLSTSDSTFVLATGHSRSEPCSIAMWHTRFGHADVNMIRMMAKRGWVDGLDISNFSLCGKCEVCLLAKAKRLPFDDVVVPASEPLDRVSLDLWGRARTRSLGGAYYMLLACDDGTGIPFAYFSATKDAKSILKIVEEFVEMAECQTGCRIRVFRIDLGREFDNNLFDAWCAKRGIIVEKVPKASSAANGTIISGVRAMIEDSDLDQRFWAEAAATYSYIRGMIPTNRHPGQIPWEKWFEARGHKVNVSHLRRWGCRVWVTDLDHVEGKLGRQAWEGRMVGYIGRRGYRIWDPRRKGIYPVRDVKFEEGIPRRTLTDPSVNPTEDDLSAENDLNVNSELVERSENPVEVPVNAENPQSSTSEPSPTIVGNPPGLNSTISEPSQSLPSNPSIAPPVLRRSNRLQTPSARLLQSMDYEEDAERARERNEEWANIIVLASTIKGGGVVIPKSYLEAMRESDLWLPPMQKEIDSLRDRGCWSIVERPENTRIMNGMWVFDLKIDGEGTILKRKARYVARGDMQIPGVDFDKSWSMVARAESVRLLIAICAFKRLQTRQWDFSAAYLNGTLPKDPPVYMNQPVGFTVKGEEEKVCLMHKPLYGMSQAGHIWYKELEEQFRKLGFKSSRADPCIRFRRNEKTNEYSIASVHTDDVFCGSSTSKEADDTVKGFKVWDLTDVKDKKFLVGLTVEHRDDGSIAISQSPFFINTFRHFGIEDQLRPIYTPLPPNFSLSSLSPRTEDDIAFMKDKPYRAILGCCWWGASCTRPDIVFTCSVLSTVQDAPSSEHWNLLIKLCRYIHTTIYYGIVYRPGSTELIKPVGYVDADWAGDRLTRKSMSGYIFLVNGAPVSWSSKRQASVALSSTESEYISMSRGIQQALWTRSWFDEIEMGLGDRTMDVFCDNLGAISLSETNKEHNLSKHIDIRYHFIRDVVGRGKVTIHPVQSNQNLADIMTKSLPKDKHRRIVSALGLDWWYSERQGECQNRYGYA